jgi:hypothetical protein
MLFDATLPVTPFINALSHLAKNLETSYVRPYSGPTK